MSLSTITALSPLDGRYASKLAALRPIMSEHGYMHRRVQVEIAWFIALSDAGFEVPSARAVGGEVVVGQHQRQVGHALLRQEHHRDGRQQEQLDDARLGERHVGRDHVTTTRASDEGVVLGRMG